MLEPTKLTWLCGLPM
ncbi:hypothetical protein F383_36670 [Gossypium arboreum]|uniref:Uncharacterized protein n=1 Tax=Gossypium arboreum TaxID=29729 RepID=A0A0B0N967_GOSAR|nr:hypothetical protein F383_36670 [Gossypium arboreum]